MPSPPNSAKRAATSPSPIDREERRKDKKRKKQEAKLQMLVPSFQFVVNGFSHGRKIGIAHLRDLALHIVSDAPKPTWIQVENKPSIASLTVLFIPGISPQLLGAPVQAVTQNMPFAIPPAHGTHKSGVLTNLPVVQRLFSHACPVRSPGDRTKLHSALAAFLQSPLSLKDKEKKEKDKEALLRAATSLPPTLPSHYLLTRQEMKDHSYPIPHLISSPLSGPIALPNMNPDDAGEILNRSRPLPVDSGLAVGSDGQRVIYKEYYPDKEGRNADEDGWVETGFGGTPSELEDLKKQDKIPVLALDCEMCMTLEGPQLARISIVEFESRNKIYDELVKPSKPVTDYLTQFSGITKEALDTATLTLPDIQAHLLHLLERPTILLGHSLESDLKAIKLRHPWCIDTAVIFKHPRGPPLKTSLRWLAKTFLGKDIQRSTGGHDSEEDARTCLELLHLKLKFGPAFGDPAAEMEPIFQKIQRTTKASGEPKLTALCDRGNPARYLTQETKVTTLKDCASDDEVVEELSKVVGSHWFSFGRLTSLSEGLGWARKSQASVASTPSLITTDTDAINAEADIATTSHINSSPDVTSILTSLNAQIEKVHSSLSSRGGLIIFTGHSDPRKMLELIAKRTKFENLLKVHEAGPDKRATLKLSKEDRWMEEDERQLEVETALAREGLAFFCVKN
ncbi:3'-5' exonuclease [Phaffia rhodozyma]|uniref:3'-5' exonuclease n=1 Tax=Phaffia rhodozyma TaxID=264483 RepID=A0A0F7SN75_PHARH|nr:3'-5' exonuclease [Phaffia rhodozyma]